MITLDVHYLPRPNRDEYRTADDIVRVSSSPIDETVAPKLFKEVFCHNLGSPFGGQVFLVEPKRVAIGGITPCPVAFKLLGYTTPDYWITHTLYILTLTHTGDPIHGHSSNVFAPMRGRAERIMSQYNMAPMSENFKATMYGGGA